MKHAFIKKKKKKASFSDGLASKLAVQDGTTPLLFSVYSCAEEPNYFYWNANPTETFIIYFVNCNLSQNPHK